MTKASGVDRGRRRFLKGVALTGALAPARFRVTDAIFNLGLALGAVQSKPPGVYLAMNGTVFSAGAVWKNRGAGRFEALPLPETSPDRTPGP